MARQELERRARGSAARAAAPVGSLRAPTAINHASPQAQGIHDPGGVSPGMRHVDDEEARRRRTTKPARPRPRPRLRTGAPPTRRPGRPRACAGPGSPHRPARWEEAVEHEVGRIVDPHLALADPRKPVAPEVVPDRQPTRLQGARTAPPSGPRKNGHVAADRHLPADADRPEPDEQACNHGSDRDGPAARLSRRLAAIPGSSRSGFSLLSFDAIPALIRTQARRIASTWRKSLQNASAILHGIDPSREVGSRVRREIPGDETHPGGSRFTIVGIATACLACDVLLDQCVEGSVARAGDARRFRP